MKTLIGLTGKTGAGKSTISNFLRENGAYIIDGDIVARQVLCDDKALLEKLCQVFGNVLNSDGTLNRRGLAERAFSTPESTEKLNSVMHPVINEYIEREVEEAFEKYNVVVVDAAAIIESGFTKKCHKVIVVTAPVDVRMRRIIARDNLSSEDALIRINGQKSDEFYEKEADVVIRNYEPYSLGDQLDELKKELFS